MNCFVRVLCAFYMHWVPLGVPLGEHEGVFCQKTTDSVKIGAGQPICLQSVSSREKIACDRWCSLYGVFLVAQAVFFMEEILVPKPKVQRKINHQRKSPE